MKTTLKDIAEKAGVSISTVSRVINDDQDKPISDETRKLVWKYVKELGYSKNNRKKSIKRNTKKIGYILNNTPNIYNHPYFSVILNSIETELKKTGYSLGFSFAEDDIKKEAIRHQIITEEADGLIIIAEYIDEELTAKIRENFENIVSINYLQTDLKSDVICIEMKKAGYNATKFLIDKGHSRIAFIGGTLTVELPELTYESRYQGFEKAMREARLNINREWVRDGDWTLDGGYIEMKKILSSGDLPTAVFTASDLMAIGAMRAIHESGLVVPTDISVISFDDIDMAKYTNPQLTTIHVPKEEIGRLAVKLLMDQINGNNPDFPIKVVVPTELVIRGSVTNPEN